MTDPNHSEMSDLPEGREATVPSSEPSQAIGGSEAEGPGGVRRRRRPRRRGRRGEGVTTASGEGSGEVSEEGGEADAGNETAAPMAMTAGEDLGELFSKLVSGQYDQEDDPEAPEAAHETLAAESPEGASEKRVLAPDAEAPKLHKVLAQSGVGSRRDLEAMISGGRVSVNGEVAHVGQRISWGDRITLDGKPVKVRIAPVIPRVIAYHKPAGEVVTHDDPQQRPTVFRKLPRLAQGKWQSVGRLDINTEGLLLFTNSGDLANRLMHPRFGVEREYAVRILGTLTDEDRERLLTGVEIDGQTAAFKSIEDGGGEGANRWYRVVITEGRNREVRKLFDAAGHAVSRLIRVRYGVVVLPKGLRRGMCVDLSGDDIKALRGLTGMALGAPGSRPARGKGRPQAGGKGGPARQGPGGPSRDRNKPPKSPRNAKARQDGPRRGQVFDYADDQGEVATGAIPNPLQQTFDRRALQQAQRQRAVREDGPIPNPLQQTYDRRAVQDERRARKVYDEDGPIPNPLQQTYDRRAVQGERGAFGAPGKGRGAAGAKTGSSGQRKGRSAAGGGQPDPMRTSVGYIGADAFHGKGKSGRGGGGRKR